MKQPTRVKADPAKPGEIGAPIPGVVSIDRRGAESDGQEGRPLLVMEAMKMQSTVYAPVAGAR